MPVQDSDYSDWSLKEWINATKRQQAFLDAFVPLAWEKAAKFPFYGGAAGGGKSYILRKALVLFLIRAHARWNVQNCRVALFCEDYPSLRDRQISKIKEEFPSHLGKLKSDRDLGDIFLLNPEFGSGFIALRNLDDPGKYDSTEFAAMAVDEFTKNKNGGELFDQLRKRLRWTTNPQKGGRFPPGFKHPLAAASNPGGKSHGEAKKLWITRDFPKWLQPFAKEFVYVPAKVADNPYLPEGYLDDLMSLRPDLAAAFAEGSWDQFAGQFFGEWRDAYHIVEPFEIPKFWKRIICVDWGWSAPCAILFLAISPDGDVYVYRELYGTQRLPSWWAERILEACEQDGVQLADYKRVIDPATFGHDPMLGQPVEQSFREAGVTFERANNDRLNGWIQVHAFLGWERDPEDETLELVNLLRRPKLYVLRDHAKNLVRTLPNLPRDENRIEDVDTDAEDHAPDALRYGLMTRPALTKIPFSVLSRDWKEAMLRAQRREQERGK